MSEPADASGKSGHRISPHFTLTTPLQLTSAHLLSSHAVLLRLVEAVPPLLTSSHLPFHFTFAPHLSLPFLASPHLSPEEPHNSFSSHFTSIYGKSPELPSAYFTSADPRPSRTSPRPMYSAPLPLMHPASPHLTSPHLTSPHLTSTHLTSPHLTLPHLTSPHLTSTLVTWHQSKNPQDGSCRTDCLHALPRSKPFVNRRDSRATT